jgi:uncharacterized NAD(P)/FAD-binding protein YdhS
MLPVLIAGTGLTMADTCMTLSKRNHQGKIIAVSHHGYLPAVHKYGNSYPSFFEELKETNSLIELFSIIKKHIRTAEKIQLGWRSVRDSLRPFTQQLWQKLSLNDKITFLKRFNRIWSVARHRIPEEYDNMLRELIFKNQLEVTSGKIKEVREAENGFDITIQKRKSFNQKINVDCVINCTGPQINYLKINNPLITNLLKKGIIETGPLNLGTNATPEGKVIS